MCIRDRIMELLCNLNRDLGITILMVTHENDVAAYAKRVVHVVDGLIDSDVINERPMSGELLSGQGPADLKSQI